MYYIGIDLGTSAVKLLLVDENGGILNTVTREYPLEFPKPGWSQQNPEDWKRAVLEGVPQLLQGFDGAKVAGIGCGGQMHGLVVLDEQDSVIRPAILWNDGRTAAQDRGQGDPGPPDGQHRLRRVYRAEALVDAGKRAGELFQNQEDYAAQGLYQLYSYGRALL